jgi:hypothetical protein
VKTQPVTDACCVTAGSPPVTFTYLGTGGWLIRSGNDAVMTAPMFTNPRVWRLLFPMSPSRRVVERQLNELGTLDDVRLLLAGHAHYDHLLDVPLVAPRLRNATLFGGPTAIHELSSVDIAREEAVADRPITRGRIRVRPIASEHAAHYRHAKAFFGHVRADEPLPRRAWNWLEGETFAFLIDFLDEKENVTFRIYYDDAAHDAPYGYPDEAMIKHSPVDVAILCAASFHNTAAYPKELVDFLQPKHVLVGHWEDFFLPYEHRERTVRGTPIPEFLKKLTRPYTEHSRQNSITFTSR